MNNSRTRRIPRSEWEVHKPRIIELYRDVERPLLGPDGVIETMEKEGFSATLITAREDYFAPGINNGGMTRENAASLMPTREGSALTENHALEITIPGGSSDNGASTTADLLRTGHSDLDHSTSSVDHANQGTYKLFQHNDSSLNFSIIYPSDPLDSIDFGLLLDEFFASNPQQWMLRKSQWRRPSAVVAAPFMRDIYDTTRPTPSTCIVLNTYSLASDLLIPAEDSNLEFYAPISVTVLKGLLSSEILFGEESFQPPNNIPIDVLSTALFFSRICTSFVNGFAGLENIPPARILKLLEEYQTINLSIIQRLVFDHGPATKSLAKSIFQAAIEQDNVNVVEFVLKTKLVHANDTPLQYQNERYTSFERSVIAHSFKVAKFLLGQNIDVNKSFPRNNMSGDGPLETLLRHGMKDSMSTLSDQFLDLVDALLSLGITVYPDALRWALQVPVDQRLTIRLIEKSSSYTHQGYMREIGLLAKMVHTLEKPDAKRMLKLMIQSCKAMDADWYFYQYHEFVKSQPDELVEILFPRLWVLGEVAKDTNIQVEEPQDQTRGPRLHVKSSGGYVFYTMGTESFKPVTAAFDSKREERLLALIESNGEPENLTRCELGESFSKALRKGYLQFANKILEMDPDFEFAESPRFELDKVLGAALDHYFDDIALKLVDFGMTPSRVSKLLIAVVAKRQPTLLNTILDSLGDSVESCKDDEIMLIMTAAIDWGDASIIRRLWLAGCNRLPNHCKGEYRGKPFFRRFLAFLYERSKMGLFWDIFHTIPSTHLAALRVALLHPDTQLLDELISHGASVSSTALLDRTIRKQPSMVKPLLERYRKANPNGRAGYGWWCIMKAIHHHHRYSEWLDTFFEYGLVAGETLQSFLNYQTLLVAAILSSKHPSLQGQSCKELITRILDAGSDINVIITGEKIRYGSRSLWVGRMGTARPYRDFTSECSMSDSDTSDSTTKRKYYRKTYKWDFDIHFSPTPGSTKTTALLYAIELDSIEITQLLIQRGAKLNDSACVGIMWTPLQKAAELNNAAIVSLLLDSGADVNAPPPRFRGATALQYAAINGNCQMVAELVEHGARLDVPPPRGGRGRWPLEGAAENGRFDMIQLLWDINVGPFDNEQCRKAMRLAKRQGHIGCEELISRLMAGLPIES
ncbi:hypothetical protein GGS24DRAFT_514322 [Hypoxylon argillaceum]|nr:hypothetical protein GGS24DRAFT_514322 [Hypoxylon argillaceum]